MIVAGLDGDMRLKSAVQIALTAGLALTPMGANPAAGNGSYATVKRTVQAAYFSEACRNEVKALDLAPSPDAGALFGAFAWQLAARSPDERAELGAGWLSKSNAGDCALPTVLLINLFRLNGIDAELVLASILPADMPRASPNKIHHVLVYVPTLNRYFDAAESVAAQGTLDRTIRGGAARMHFIGPSIKTGARDPCLNVCLYVFDARRSPYAVRVQTESIPAR